jgi:hypothetical protein
MPEGLQVHALGKTRNMQVRTLPETYPLSGEINRLSNLVVGLESNVAVELHLFAKQWDRKVEVRLLYSPRLG